MPVQQHLILNNLITKMNNMCNVIVRFIPIYICVYVGYFESDKQAGGRRDAAVARGQY